MASSAVAKSCSDNSTSSSQVSPAMLVQEKGSRNKRKFRADPPPLTDPNKTISPSQNDYLRYEFSAENFVSQEHSNGCDMCSFSHENTDPVELDLRLSCSVGVGSAEVGSNHNRVEIEASDEYHDADWSDLTESQLEELVLANLDTIFKSAIKKIVSFGYTKEVATKAVLRSGLCYGCKDAVSNIVNNTLVFLRNGQEVDSSREHHFEDLQQMEKYILAELVCVVREVRPFFSTGDAMWCLLVSDMNISHACTMDSETLCSLVGDGASNGCISDSVETQLKKEANSTGNPQSPCKPTHSSLCAHSSPLEAPVMASIACGHNSMSGAPTKAEVPQSKPKAPFVLNRFASEKENRDSTYRMMSKSFSPSSQNQEEKVVGGRKITGINKRESILRQKSVHLEKSYRTYGSKGASRAGKLSNFGGLLLDKKLKSVSESTGINLKNLSLKMSKGVGIGLPQDNITDNGSTQIGLPSSSVFNTETADNSISTLPQTSIPLMLPSVDSPPALLAAETELSLSHPPKGNDAPMPDYSNPSFSAIPYDKSFRQWISHAKKDETILKLVPRVHELQNQLQEWTEWANQKVMQAARRLGKDKAELKTLRLEKEEVERLKKEKQTLEENTMKKLSEMENALCKASGQVERANSAVRRLKMENSNLRHEMEAANLRAAESAASCEEVSKREKKTLMQFQSWEKLKTLFQEELVTERRKLTQLQQDLELAKEQQDLLEARWKQEEKAKAELVSQANSYRIGRLEGEASAKLREDLTRLKADKNLQRYKEDIEKLEKEISLLRLKADALKIAALRDGSYASKLADTKTSPSQQESHTLYSISKTVNGSRGGGVKRERECVMCLSEETCVVFLPCAHQVVCTTCNELHEKQGMKDCPSCRGPIQRRICVRYARS
ncbi:putative E3 ubiquitin-protein ligase RF298 [Cynara cardunculus var. scolymus]|uniref:Zinc finger, RING/FYVE/PHD-type n=1 Tax=Cynara cardunculus var. scolymus TaxID=59895 RepID=A0A103XRN9_CYNCS|nr:putative E3 ubiquitin-protein ligase RF298 [Cynara cardunculus var. scolymus]KVH95628.1 Zinc finger, RING/FYVE/PHD-type [Cynara cardunculus var. scolymus]